MTREQILKAYIEDQLLVEKGYLKQGDSEEVKWTDHSNNKMVAIVKNAIEGVMNGDSQPLMTRKINKFLDQA